MKPSVAHGLWTPLIRDPAPGSEDTWVEGSKHQLLLPLAISGEEYVMDPRILLHLLFPPAKVEALGVEGMLRDARPVLGPQLHHFEETTYTEWWFCAFRMRIIGCGEA